MSDTTKKYLISSVVTFCAGFAMVILPQLDDITLESLRGGALIGVLFAGVRAGVKALIESFIAWYSTNQ